MMFKTQITTSIVLLFFICGSAQKATVKKLKLNTELNHFSPVVVGDKIFFSYNLTTRRGRAIKDKYQGDVYAIYHGEIDRNGEIINTERIEKTELGQFNMSAATFSEDGKYMYFTSNNLTKGENKLKGIETFNLQIQRAEFEEGKGWTNFETLPFCKPNFNYAHPALSPDGSTLYFVANEKGTKGKSDLFKVSVTNHKTYGETIRLNDNINSSRSELFPFVSSDNKLYFSSDRRGGKGGMDIYVYDLESSDANQEPLSLDEPINSNGEDMTFFLMDDLSSGYVTSRRYRGEGGDDIYYFTGFKD